MTNPLAQDDAKGVDILERTSETIAENQEKLKSGAMKKADYDKSLVESRKKIEEIATKYPRSAAIQTSAARAYTQSGDLDKAIAHASQAMSLAPHDPFPITTRGLAYFKANNFSKAAEDAKKALAIEPDNPVAGALYKLSKDRGGSQAGVVGRPAVIRSQEALTPPPNRYLVRPASRPDDDPEIARYKTEAGRNYARQVIATEKAMERKDYVTAFGLANSALSTYADNPRVLAARAVAAWNLQDYRTAVADSTLVLKAHPDASSMLMARAAAYNDMGRHAEALQDAEKAVGLAPSNARVLLERAIAREAMQDSPADALADFKKAAELDPGFTTDYQQALARLTPQQSGQEVAAKTATEAQRQGFVGKLAGNSRRISTPWAMAGLAGLACLAAAGLLLIRRS